MLYEADLQYMLFPLKQKYCGMKNGSEKPPTVKNSLSTIARHGTQTCTVCCQVNHSSWSIQPIHNHQFWKHELKQTTGITNKFRKVTNTPISRTLFWPGCIHGTWKADGTYQITVCSQDWELVACQCLLQTTSQPGVSEVVTWKSLGTRYGLKGGWSKTSQFQCHKHSQVWLALWHQALPCKMTIPWCSKLGLLWQTTTL